MDRKRVDSGGTLQVEWRQEQEQDAMSQADGLWRGHRGGRTLSGPAQEDKSADLVLCRLQGKII